MAKITLGKTPKSFPHVVSIDLPGGERGSIEVSYIYRTRTAYGDFVDNLHGESGFGLTPKSDEDAEKKSMKAILEKSLEWNVEYLMQIIDGWNLDEEFSRENVSKLCDELPGVVVELIYKYRLAITEGRLGN